MSEFEFIGDVENLIDTHFKLVENVLLKQGFKEGTVVIEDVGKKGDNYMASVKRFTIERGDGTSFKLIAKMSPTNEIIRDMMNSAVLFNNETVIYQEVLPKFIELQNMAGVPDNEKIRFPICYGVLSDPPNEFIVLEDLGLSGFAMLDRFQPLPDAAIQLVLKDLAIFHSISYALKSKDLPAYKNLANKLKNIWVLFKNDPNTNIYFEATENDMKKLMDNKKYIDALSGTLSLVGDLNSQLQQYDTDSKYSVIQQGDCWTNNILFKLEDGKPIQNVLIDYQLSKESNPAADILYLLLNCTDHKQRSQHYNEWVDYYYAQLDSSLANYGLKANLVFPKDQLDANLIRYGKLLTGSAVLLSSMLVRESHDVVDFNDVKNMNEANKNEYIDLTLDKMKSEHMDRVTVKRLKTRIEGLLDSALQFGLI